MPKLPPREDVEENLNPSADLKQNLRPREEPAKPHLKLPLKRDPEKPENPRKTK